MGSQITPLINGREYTWADVSFNIGGVPVVGVTKINYDEEQVKEDNWGAGINPVSRGYGNRKASSSVTMYASEAEALADRAPNGNLLDYGTFDVTVQFMVGAVIKTHVLKNCEFTKNERNMSQGDTKIEVDLPLIVSHIKWKK
jgi:hypothetical protein